MMRYLPERKSLFDDMFDSMFNGSSFNSANALMRTDIREKDGKYLLDIDLPGYAKEDIRISLYNGNLTIHAEHNDTQEEKDAKGNILRQERYRGSVSRSFYVGDAIRETDVHASFNNGTLTVEIPTAEKKEAEEKKFISSI